ncbi:MAG TPA: sigma-54 dependent transcriptional regulator [Kofleriaceae bacterium]|nr:sigma-54 dependent transcriptional regulator [Kofleriaceae bacterium]
MARILIVDDEPKLGRVLVEMLERAGHEVTHAEGGAAALTRIAAGGLDVVVTDLRMPGVDGMVVLREVRRLSPGTDVMLMTAHATAQNAVDAMKQGAVDYLVKPFAMDEFRLRISHLIDRRSIAARADALARRLDARDGFGRVVAESAAMKKVVTEARQVATTGETVLLLGESGTGRNLIARAIHNASARSAAVFVEVHAAALPETLVEGELFGRDKGAYTGATDAKPGHAEIAHGGTLFLDEIGELPAVIQVKLLRFLQDRTFTRLGSTQSRRSDARIIAATNRDLAAAVKDGTFREDLYYRLAVFPIVVPPLRDRPDDIRATALSLLAARGLGPDRITQAALDCLAAYRWPGNVRELENALGRALVLAGTEPIAPSHLPSSLARTGEPTSTSILDDLLVPNFSIDAFERDLIHHALEKAGGNKTAAARMLGITRRRLYSRLDSMGEPDGGDD